MNRERGRLCEDRAGGAQIACASHSPAAAVPACHVATPSVHAERHAVPNAAGSIPGVVKGRHARTGAQARNAAMRGEGGCRAEKGLIHRGRGDIVLCLCRNTDGRRTMSGKRLKRRLPSQSERLNRTEARKHCPNPASAQWVKSARYSPPATMSFKDHGSSTTYSREEGQVEETLLCLQKVPCFTCLPSSRWSCFIISCGNQNFCIYSNNAARI